MFTCLRRHPMALFLVVPLVLSSFFARFSEGQDPPAAETAAEPEAEAAAEPAAATEAEPVAEPVADSPSPPRPFADVYNEWKEVLKQLRDLQEKHKNAQESELEGILADFARLMAQGHTMLPQLRASAIAAYRESPNADTDLSRFLIKLIDDDILTENYERGKELATMLIEAQNKEPELTDFAGRVAFASNDFEAAEKHLQAAKEAGTLSDTGQAHLDIVGQYKDFWAKEQEIRKAEAEAEDLPRVKLKTNKGDIVIELFENEAPQTVGNFINLVDNGFYDGLAFHRVLPAFMAQSGCPQGDGLGGPGYKIYCECNKENHRKHFRGSLSMAKSTPPNTGGSQFFLTFVPTPHLNGKHTVFGRIVEGLDVLAKLRRRDPDGAQGPKDVEPDKIESAEVLRKREHEYLPTKVAE